MMQTRDFDPRIAPPKVSPVPEGVHRPKWSVMIPTFNCASYLRKTLESVLSQDPGHEQMQIEVIDDCSTMDNPADVVREIGRGRVDFYRKPKNEGAIPNFNTCIERSRGYLIHILHGDDWVLPGFYNHVGQKADSIPDISGFFTRCFVVDEEGSIEEITQRMKELESGGRLQLNISDDAKIRTPAVVIRRTFYEKSGVFLPPLVHTADMEMWIRCIRVAGGISINLPLAAYRIFSGNDTSRLRRTAENLKDTERCIAVLSANNPKMDPKPQIWHLCTRAMGQEVSFRSSGDEEAAKASHEFWSLRVGVRFKINKKIQELFSFIRI